MITKAEYEILKPLLVKAGVKTIETSHHKGDASKPHLIRVDIPIPQLIGKVSFDVDLVPVPPVHKKWKPVE